jgi:hypothetical protein
MSQRMFYDYVFIVFVSGSVSGLAEVVDRPACIPPEPG